MEHTEEVHGKKMQWHCNYCSDLDFDMLSDLKQHLADKHMQPVDSHFYPCCECGIIYRTMHRILQHNKMKHSNKYPKEKPLEKEVYPCTKCGKIMGRKGTLQRHMRIHAGETTCACEHCGKTFLSQSNLKVHLLTHSGLKPFQCQEPNCDVAYTTKQCLQVHYRKAHDYTDETMPPIKRSVPFTFEDYNKNSAEEIPSTSGKVKSGGKAENKSVQDRQKVPVEFPDLAVNVTNDTTPHTGTMNLSHVVPMMMDNTSISRDTSTSSIGHVTPNVDHQTHRQLHMVREGSYDRDMNMVPNMGRDVRVIGRDSTMSSPLEGGMPAHPIPGHPGLPPPPAPTLPHIAPPGVQHGDLQQVLGGGQQQPAPPGAHGPGTSYAGPHMGMLMGAHMASYIGGHVGAPIGTGQWTQM